RRREVAGGRAYRTPVSKFEAGNAPFYYQGDFSPDSRLLAVGIGEGTRLWHLGSGRQVAELPTPAWSSFFLGPSPGALLTAGARGLDRWPLQPARIGPPRHLGPIGLVNARRDRQALVGATDTLLWVLDVDSGKARQF